MRIVPFNFSEVIDKTKFNTNFMNLKY
jgi:hypothetical protein